MIDFMEVTREYGLITAIAVSLHIPVYGYLLRKKAHIDAIPGIQEKLKNVHLECHIKPESITNINKEIVALKNKDTEIDGDIKEILEHLKANDKTFDKLEAKVDRVLDILIKKAMYK